MSRHTGWFASAALALFAFSAPMSAQSLEQRIAAAAAAGDGLVSFHYTARAGVCGDGEHFVRTGQHSYHGRFTAGRLEPCELGPVQVRLKLENGVVDRLQFWVGRLRHRAAHDIGAVAAPEAARYLMTIASRGTASASAKAIFPAVLADSAIVWPALLSVARDDARSSTTRKEALLWLGHFAGGAVAGHPNDPFEVDDAPDDEDDDLKAHAIFVLSQLPRGEGVPQLLQAARSNHSPRVRRQAFFWLGQSGDPRAVDVFESILRR